MLTRRRLLAGGLAVPAAGLLAGCGSSAEQPLLPTADETARDQARSGEQSLLDLYAATLTAHPGLAPRLAPLRDHHVAHLAALAAPAPTGSTSASPSAVGAAPAPPTVPVDEAQALRAVVTAESQAGEARAGQVPSAGAELAVLLASVCAAERTHAAFLAGTLDPGKGA